MSALLIRDSDTYRTWIAGIPSGMQQKAAVTLCQRATLRALVVLAEVNDNRFEQAFMDCVRCLLLAGLGTKSVSNAIYSSVHGATSQLELQLIKTNQSDAVNVFKAALFCAFAVLDDGRYVANSFRSITEALDALVKNSTEIDFATRFWNELQTDALGFQTPSLSKSVPQQLWKNGTPTWWDSMHTSLRTRLSERDFLLVWDDWYECILKGKSFFQIPTKFGLEPERKVALGATKDFWNGSPRSISLQVRGIISGYGRQIDPKDDPRQDTLFSENQAEPPIPKAKDFQSKPASIQTDVIDDIIGLDPEAPVSDISKTRLKHAIEDLSLSFDNLVVTAKRNNASMVFIAFCNETGTSLLSALENQQTLFKCGRALQTLRSYSNTVDKEWENFGAAEYHSVLIQFDGILRKFPVWRQFTAQPTEKSGREVIVNTNDAIAELIGEFAKNVAPVRSVVIERLQVMSNELKNGVVRLNNSMDSLSDENKIIESEIDNLVADAVESLSNVLRSAAKFVTKYAIEPFWDGVKKQLPETANKLGRQLVKWTAGGTAIYVISQIFPSVFSWMGPLVSFIRQIIT